jgi:hypothetical protein
MLLVLSRLTTFFKELEFGERQILAAAMALLLTIQDDSTDELLARRDSIQGPWEYLDSKGTISTGLKSDLLRYEFNLDFSYGYRRGSFSGYVGPSFLPVRGSYISELKNFDDAGVFLPGAADAEKRFSLYLYSRDTSTVRELKVRKQRAGELTIGGNTYKRGA